MKNTVSRNQKGYVGMSKSVRAVMAEESGSFPRSRWTKQMLLYWIGDALYFALDLDMEQEEIEAAFAGLKKQDLAEALIGDGWHHVGPFARPVDYFRISEIFAISLAESKGLAIARKLRVAFDSKKIRSKMRDIDDGFMRFEDLVDQYGYLAVK